MKKIAKFTAILGATLIVAFSFSFGFTDTKKVGAGVIPRQTDYYDVNYLGGPFDFYTMVKTEELNFMQYNGFSFRLFLQKFTNYQGIQDFNNKTFFVFFNRNDFNMNGYCIKLFAENTTTLRIEINSYLLDAHGNYINMSESGIITFRDYNFNGTFQMLFSYENTSPKLNAKLFLTFIASNGDIAYKQLNTMRNELVDKSYPLLFFGEHIGGYFLNINSYRNYTYNYYKDIYANLMFDFDFVYNNSFFNDASYGKGYADGTINGYNKGFDEGARAQATSSNWFLTFTTGFAGIFSLEIFPGITLGLLAGIPLILGFIFLIFKLKGSG